MHGKGEQVQRHPVLYAQAGQLMAGLLFLPTGGAAFVRPAEGNCLTVVCVVRQHGQGVPGDNEISFFILVVPKLFKEQFIFLTKTLRIRPENW